MHSNPAAHGAQQARPEDFPAAIFLFEKDFAVKKPT
jgi:hypothetical protein